MAEGQLHSTGTVCRAKFRCPIDGGEGKHFDSEEALVDYTVERTGADRRELQDVLDSGVNPAEAVSMAESGVLGNSTPASISREKDGYLPVSEELPKVPGYVRVDLSGMDEHFRTKFVNEMIENGQFPVASANEQNGVVSLVLDMESDPDDYSATMAASEALSAVGEKEELDGHEQKDLLEFTTINAEIGEKDGESLKL